MCLDAFDETELISGRNGVEFFLKDIDEITRDNISPSVYLFARTETGKFLENYCILHNMAYNMYEISFFSEIDAKTFIKERYCILGNSYTAAVENCINDIFVNIKKLLSSKDVSESFLGYAPVLEAISISLMESRNTSRLIEGIRTDSNVGARIIFKILKDLLSREQEKVVNAFKERCNSHLIDSIHWKCVYNEKEQLVRIMEFVFFHQVEEQSLFINDCIPPEMYDDYYEVMRLQLIQHPFLQNLNKNQNYDFAGPAFRDYTLSRLMCSEYYDLADEYLKEKRNAGNNSSQLLFDFFREQEGVITESIFALLASG